MKVKDSSTRVCKKIHIDNQCDHVQNNRAIRAEVETGDFSYDL